MKKIFTLTVIFSLLLWITQVKAQVTNGLIQHFKFDNSYTNEAGNIAFSAASFTTDREGVPNSAILITNALQSQAVITGLPYGNAARTISFWAKSNGYSGLNYDPVFTYGTGTNSNAFSGSFSLDRVAINAHTDNATFILGFGNQNTAGTWYHFTMSYDGTTAKIYRNGMLLGSLAKNWNTINNNDIFKLGVGVGGEQWFNGAIDDLKIFDRAITDAEAELLYKGNIDVCTNLLTYFSFNSGTSDQTGTVPFTTTDPIYPVTTTLSRSGGADYAIQTFQAATQPRTATIPGLPTGNSARTIVFWLRTTTAFSTSQTYFTYGNNASAQTFGLYNNASGNLVFQGFGAGNDVTTTATIAQNTWVQVAVVHNSNMVKIYTNGILRHSFTPTNTLNTGNSTFKIGAFNGAVDDLAIYSRALSFGEIEHLYNNSVLSCPAKPVISAVSSVANTTSSATINYSLRANNLPTTSVIRYGLAANSLTEQVTGITASGNTVTPANVVLSGLQGNTQYFFQIEATNSEGSTTTTGDFITFGQIAKYEFNNTYNNVNGTIPFSSTNTSFGPDRNNNPNSALIRSSAVNTNSASILNLPISTTRRTISLWVKSTDAANNSSSRGIFLYGAGATGALFGAYFNTSGGITFQGNNDQAITNSTIVQNQWFHFALSYDGTNVRAYINGDLKHTFVKPLGTTNSAFSIGNFIGSLDDLHIYNYVLSDTEVNSLFANNAVLPVNLKSFTAKAQNNSAILNWETATETNNSHFIIKKSVDGENFTPITTVTAKFANGAKYQFIDNNPANGTNYYQLLQVDLDGKTTDLGVKTVSFSIKNIVKAFPNPAIDKVDVTFSAGIYNAAKLTDINGRVLQQISISKLQQSITLSIGNYAKGLYLLQLSGGQEKSTQRIVKL
ncbi:LamG-like jellyroll fold domain-containing protein [Pedobacter sp. SL55]|uniref:LamG-like jellyroll fold domain-containing protein n=1 Tax=Pedobacter sp. SL55 TaxID=2995161 RepID=UPI00226F7FB0|nr:LamG-like jellyroll fold domain-containing protein [Pedobacter sp. SL55]WAC40294.1 T9SS type A sorting domain-containing protein [Pedobacter sp. SL55]